MTTLISPDEGWDRTFLDLSSKCAEPICWAYGLLRYRLIAPLDPNKFDNFQNKMIEVAYRAFIFLAVIATLAVFALPVAAIVLTLGIASRVLRAVGFAMQKDNFTHVRGDLAETTLPNGEAKVMTWNVCGPGGGLPYDHGGVTDWRIRLDGMIGKILTENSDVLILQEIYDTALAEALIEKLKNHYSHFFIHLGANTMGSVGGLMVLSKCAVHQFTNPSFANNSWTLNRTFANLEIKANPSDQTACARIIGTHLIHDDNQKRIEQFDQIRRDLEMAEPLPTILMGDLNLERDIPEQGGILTPYLEHGYLANEPTRTQQLLKQWDEGLIDPGDFIDYISVFRGHGPNVQLIDTHLVKAYSDAFDTRTALSDHNGLAATFRFR